MSNWDSKGLQEDFGTTYMNECVKAKYFYDCTWLGKLNVNANKGTQQT